jgi:rod shape-determining protein MreC
LTRRVGLNDVRGSFLWRNRVLLTSGVLLILSLHLISTGVRPGDLSARPQSAVLEIISPIDAAFAHLSEGASSIVGDYADLLHVRDENKRLRDELARVNSDHARLAEFEVENQHLGQLLELRDTLGTDAVAANVIGSDATGLSRTLILSSGSGDGLRVGMAVLANEGVVGKVIATSPHASRVLLIDDHNSALDGFDQRSRARGIVAGVVDDGLILKYADRSQDIQNGDTVVTSGLDGIFPRGLLVGTIKNVRREGPGLFLDVSIAPAVDFRGLEQVLILTQPPPHLDDQAKD